MKLSRLLRRDPGAPSLRERAAELRRGLARIPQREAPTASLPAPGSPEAVSAFEAAYRELTRLTPLTSEDHAALRIGDTFTLWTTEWIKAARRGDYSRFSLREFEVARSKTPAELSDLLVMTTRRDLQFAEAEQRTGIKTLFALAYPNGEDPEPLLDPEGDDAHIAIAEHRAAYAAWKPLGDALNETTTNHDAFMAAQDEPHRIQAEAFEELIDTHASTPAGLRALAAYLPGAVFDANCVEVEEDARRALRSMCFGVLAVVEDAEADAELLWLGRLFEVARAREIAACDAANVAQEEADRRELPRPACLTYRASDHELSVYGWHTHPEVLDGIKVGAEDVARLRRKVPMHHEVLRPIHDGERAHIDHPGRKFDIVYHHEAQDRAEEIISAWDAWHTERFRIRQECVTPEIETEAEQAGEAAAGLAYRIAALPAETAAGLRVKLRAAAHYAPTQFKIALPELPDPDQVLFHSLRKDAERAEGAPLPPAIEPALRIVDRIDIGSATMEELQSFHDLADRVGSFAYALSWTGRCQVRGERDHMNAVGDFMTVLGDALTEVETACIDEARRRAPTGRDEREIQFQLLALPVIQNGDLDEVEAFSRDLAAFAAAERAKA